MNRRFRKGVQRSSESTHASHRTHSRKPTLIVNDKWFGREAASRLELFIGPSVSGADERYEKVLSGKIEVSKLSFAK